MKIMITMLLTYDSDNSDSDDDDDDNNNDCDDDADDDNGGGDDDYGDNQENGSVYLSCDVYEEVAKLKKKTEESTGETEHIDLFY